MFLLFYFIVCVQQRTTLRNQFSTTFVVCATLHTSGSVDHELSGNSVSASHLTERMLGLQMHATTCGILHGLWGLNSGHQDYKAS